MTPDPATPLGSNEATPPGSPAPPCDEVLLDPRVRALLSGRFPGPVKAGRWISQAAVGKGSRTVAGFLAAGVLLVVQLLLGGMALEVMLRALVGPAQGALADVLGYVDAVLCLAGLLLVFKLRRLLAGQGWLFTFRAKP